MKCKVTLILSSTQVYKINNLYILIYNYSNKIGLNCFASVFNNSDYDKLKKVDTKFIKIPHILYFLDLCTLFLNAGGWA